LRPSAEPRVSYSGYRERLAESLPRVREAIAEAAASAGRDPASVRLVAVSKGHPVEAAEAALDAGILDLGENRVEELEGKVARLGRRARWHLIGHLQSRKAARALEAAELIHSLDSLKLAERLSRAAEEQGRERVPVLLQVNVSGEETKGGFSGAGALESLVEVAEVPRLRVEGLMTMAPLTEDERVLRATFRGLRALLEALRRARPEVGAALSMGMTNDLRIAVEEGSTMVRIGTALFGDRETSMERRG
jgi:pyridoxal phosphate enzyme (YggS family)